MRILHPISIIAVLLTYCHYGKAQSIVINNPSTCSIGLNLTDGGCDPNVNVIPDPDRVVINVNNAPGNTLGVDVFLQEVQLIITHTWANDLDIRLKSPGGQEIPLSLDNGGGDDNYGDMQPANCTGVARLSMNSCTSVVGATAPFLDQPYRPQGSYYDFNDGSTDPNGLWELSICDDAEGDLGSLEYVNLIFAPLDCLPVEEVSIQGQDTTSITLHWLPESSCGTSIIEYGPPGFQPGLGSSAGGGQTATVNGCPPFTLTGLQADTEYELYVRKDCGNGSLSGNSCPISFVTGCLPGAASLRSDFDGLALCDGFCDTECDFDSFWKNGPNNEFDWLVNTGGTTTFGTGPENDAGGNGNYLYLEASSGICESNKTAYLESNCLLLDKQGSDSCHLSFFYHMYGDGIGSLSLQASDNGGFSWSTLWQRQGNQGHEWQKVYISLSDFDDGSTLQMRFVGQEGSSSRGDIALDEIVFYGSQDAGEPAFEYFADNDSDGFGNAGLSQRSCSPSAPAGFVSVAGDCNDDDPGINPGEEETPCNGVDENCNGEEDDPLLPPLAVTSDTICPGEGAQVCALNAERFVFWYGSPDGDDLIGFDDCFFINSNQLANNGPVPVTYTFYAEESDGLCTSAARTAATVVVNPRPDINLLDDPEICLGQSFDLNSLAFEDNNFTGSSISFHDGFPTSGANQLDTNTVSPASNTAYYYRASTAGGCYDEGGFVLDVNQGTTLDFSPSDNFSLCRESNTTISVSPQQSGNYTYQWSNGSTDTEIEVESNFMAGATDIYTITVTDDEGCQSVDSVLVNTTVSIDSLRRFVTDVSTCAGSDGSISLIPLDGVSPYSYQWQGTNGITGDSTGLTDTLVITNLPQGAYRITVTDASPQACRLVLRSVIINGPAAVVQDVKVEAVGCAAAADGEICIDLFGGTPSFMWSTNENTPCISGLAGGSYSVTITEGECETILDSIQVEEPLPLKANAALFPPSCSNATDGYIDLSVFGGIPPYEYAWDYGVFLEDPQEISAGSYTVTITDANNCELIRTYDLPGPDPISITLDSLANISCTGGMDGSIQVSLSGGTPPYDYDWSNGSSAPLTVNLAPGAYQLTVTDFNGCQQFFSAGITEPSPIELQLIETNNPECVGEKDGSILVEASGGYAPYQYSWSVPGTDSLLDNLAVGTYFAYATDANNCPPDTLEIELNAVSVLDLDIDKTAPLCVGPESGSISLNPQGTSPFSYQWCRGDTTASISDLGVGEYCVRIEDGQGCLYDTAIVIEAPQVFGVDFNIIQPTCAGDEDGLIDVNVFNPAGVPPFQPPITYQWNDDETGDLRIGIGDGNYLTTISDAQGCHYVSDTIIIQAPPPLELAPEGLGIIRCNGDTTGFIEVSVRGGIEPYAYNWIGEGVTTEDIFNIGAGEYRLLVLDANSCPVDTTFVLEEPAPLSASIAIQSEDICEGGMVEEICANITGGAPPYALAWSNGDTSACISMPEPADYILSVTDANACQEASLPQKVKEFTEAFQLDTFYTTDVSCKGASDGCATAVVSGGSSNYNFHFSNGSPTDADTSSFTRCGLSPGNYRVTVTDQSTGCTVISDFMPLTEPPNLEFKRDSTEAVDCFQSNDGAIYTSTNGGTPPYTYYWNDSEGNTLSDSLPDILGLTAGQYTGYVVDANACTATVTATILSVNELIRDTLVDISPVRCHGDSSGAIALSILGGAMPYAYEWSNGATTLNQSMIPAGTYSLTVTDVDTCVAIFPGYVVEEPESPITFESTVDSVTCAGDENAALYLMLSGGLPPYAYEWSYEGNLLPMADTSFLEMIPGGNYELRLEDAADCVQFFSFEVYEPDPLDLQINITPPIPPDPGTASVEVEGGTPEYSYLWDNGATEATIPVEGGNYIVTVTDANECTATASVIIDQVYESSLISEARLYPNPSRRQLYLSATFERPLALQLAVFDALGQRLIDRQLEKQPSLAIELDLGGLSNGMYRLVLWHEGKVVYSGRFVKQ